MKRVLVVEDIVPLQEMWKRALLKMGDTGSIVIDTAGTVESALRYLNQYDYNVVICDYQLPDGTGGNILEWIREHKKYIIDRDRFFFCTGVPELIRHHDMPAIGKPFVPADLEGVNKLLS